MRMTEGEWLYSTNAESMLSHLRSGASPRKLRLYVCASAYDVWHRMTDQRSQDAVVTAENFADGLADRGELISAFHAAHEAWKEIPLLLGGRHGKRIKSEKGSRAAERVAQVARNAADPEWDIKMARDDARKAGLARNCALANYLRDIFGNPFRVVVIEPSWLSWNNGTVPKIAQGIYAEPSFDRLPILADALEEAGCDNTDILHHCRLPGEHVRGCWVVDLLMGKS
jgi:hypothetical protein